jgi:Glutamyl-tRNAGlu reductase, dimerisation domain
MDEPTFQSGEAWATQTAPEDGKQDKGIVCERGEWELTVEANQEQCQHEATWAKNIVREVIERSTWSIASREVLPTIVALGRRLEHIRSEELKRYRKKLNTLEPGQRGIVEALTQGIVSRIFYWPACELNDHVETSGQLTLLVARIFRLGQVAPHLDSAWLPPGKLAVDRNCDRQANHQDGPLERNGERR